MLSAADHPRAIARGARQRPARARALRGALASSSAERSRRSARAALRRGSERADGRRVARPRARRRRSTPSRRLRVGDAVADAHGAERVAVALSEPDRSADHLQDLPDRAARARGRVDAALRWSDLRFPTPARTPLLVFAVLLAIVLLVLLVRARAARRAGRTHVALPALLPVMRRVAALGRCATLPLLLSSLGVPFFAMALADPQTGFTREEVSYPGRRIALLVDASTSMVMSSSPRRFKTPGRVDVLHRGRRRPSSSSSAA